MQNTKRSFFAKIALGIGFIFASLFSVVAAFIGFFLVARSTKSVAVITITAALALVAVAFGGAWLMTRSPKTAGIYSGGVLILTAIWAWLYVYKPIPVTVPLPQPTSSTQYWQLSTGSRIAYIFHPAKGQAHSAPVIYLHGGPAVPTRTSNYEFFKQLTADGFDVYLYDQIGTGLSAQLDDISQYTLERNVADLEAIRQQIGSEKVILVGTSWGSVLAAYYLEQYPNHVEKIIFMSPGVLGDRKNVRYDYSRSASSQDDSILLPPLRMILAGALARTNPQTATNFASQAEMNGIYDAFVTSPSMDYQVNCKGYVPTNKPSRSGGGNYYANLLILQSLKKAHDPRPNLTSLQTPALIMRGACDYIPWESTLSYKQTLPNSTLILIENAGHALTEAQPEVVLAPMRAFLTDQPLPIEAYTSEQPPQ
ncbi:MAG: alpha/beta hydrolase [Chloroflexi bacterium]|nr:alpha/beta hydrolase [Chloroflexota bacterium]